MAEQLELSLLGDLDVNREQVKRGMAWAFLKYLARQILDPR